MPSNVHIGHVNYTNLKMLDVLYELSKKLHKRTDVRGPKAKQLQMPQMNVGNQITVDYLYASYANFFKSDDVIIVDSGTSFFGLLPIFLPKGSQFHSQALWTAIGWATPASFGGSLAAPDRRVILITGEGAHQMTAQEVSQFYCYDLKPIIFVLNSNGYLVE